MKIIKIACLLLLLEDPHALKSQEVDLDSRYDKAVSFMWGNLHNKRVFNLWVTPNWYADSTGFWYTTHNPEGKNYWQVTWDDQQKRPLFDQTRLAEAMTTTTGDAIQADQLPIQKVERIGTDSLKIETDGTNYRFSLADYQLYSVQKEERSSSSDSEARSPDGQWTAYTKNYNLFVRDSLGKEVQLSTDGKKELDYATWYGWADLMEGENANRPERFYADWSPDGQWLYANLVDFRTARKMYLLDWSVDSLYRPRLLSYYRGSPGDTTVIHQEPVFFRIADEKRVTTGLPPTTHFNSMRVNWTNEPNEVIFSFHSRGYQQYFIYLLDLETGRRTLLYQENSETNIDNFNYSLVLDKDCLIFFSERSGWRQLYRLNLRTKEIIPLTKGEYYVHSIERIDKEKELIYFRASGKEEGSNPYLYRLYRVDFNGKRLKALTSDDQHHQVSLSPDGNYFVDNVSTVNNPTRSVLREARTGKVLIELAQADIQSLKDWEAPQTFEAIAGDGETKIYGALWKPTDFDPTKKYPIIDNSYTGPHTNMYPSAFSQAFGNQALAELGFIVMRVDGRGSAGRSKAFHDFSYKNLGGGLTDHTHAIRQLGERFSWIDTDHVGIFGHSAGGYDAAHALLAFPETYHVAVASSADHDHRMEKAWWPEMYMGWPVDSVYHLQSNITMAGNLRGKLLITHGGIDENVNPSATFKLAEALVQADKPFDMLIFPSQRHGYRNKTWYYFLKSRWNYFIRNLKGEEPIWDIDWN